jgi:predicted signal transduction protein with EAL and GGDEF domain
VFAEKILNRVSTTSVKLHNGESINITCSAGCAYLPFEPSIPDFFTLEQVINISDFALYKAKEHGRNCSAHIRLNKKDQIKREELKAFLTTLDNDTVVNESLYTIGYIKNSSI